MDNFNTTNERYGVIYSFTNTENNKRYIGRTLHPEHRYITHIIRIKKGCNTHAFYDEYRNNPNNFKYEIIEYNILESELDNKEKYYINYFDSYNNGYNSTLGGGCWNKPVHFSKERNKKISETMKNHHPNKGKHRVYNDPTNKSLGFHYE